MPDFRVYLVTAPLPGVSQIVLSNTETHHLLNVNRARTGDRVVAFDGKGQEWICSIATSENRNSARLHLLTAVTRPPLPCRVILGQSLPKGGTMEDIVRQTTELGVAAITPLITTRSEVHLDLERATKKQEKWQLTAIEAAKQCGNPYLPEIHPLQNLADFIAPTGAGAAELKLVASLQTDAMSLRQRFADFRAHHAGRAPTSVAWLIGPEGDLTPEETSAATSAGWCAVSLGPLVLRCATAACYALASVRHETAIQPSRSL
jgi:16S rRNA (uracil1498-N3)-methyltransferase